MKRYYANLLGKWTDITENGTVEDGKSPSIYFEEMLTFQNGSTVAECFKYGYINVQYGGKNYQIHPSCIQIVTSDDSDAFMAQV